jgi:exodeoxyribonuclease VII large subunit
MPRKGSTRVSRVGFGVPAESIPRSTRAPAPRFPDVPGETPATTCEARVLPAPARALAVFQEPRHISPVSQSISAPPKALTVTELTRSIRSLLEAKIGRVWVEGEISNYRKQASGHQYFTLKDDRSQLPCVLFNSRGAPVTVTTPLVDGLCVQAFGELTVYEARGQYQLIVEVVQPRGLGALQARFEALKRKLQAEGLFEQSRKKSLPRFPRRVGLVTSPTGAALQDMLHVLRRRAPWVDLLIVPVRVQGQGAALEIAGAIGELNTWAAAPVSRRTVDLIVLARGGGSMEDLFEFNEEAVARAIAASSLPVVSAVGHEIDFTIADFAADVRAPTPSAAAEIIVPDVADLQRQLAATAQKFDRRWSERVGSARERILGFARTALTREPLRRLLDARQRLDQTEESLRRSALAELFLRRSRVDEKAVLLRPAGLQSAWTTRCESLAVRRAQVDRGVRQGWERARRQLEAAENLLRLLGPQGTLARGYSITTDAGGKVIRSVGEVQAGETILTRLSDGRLRSTAQ